MSILVPPDLRIPPPGPGTAAVVHRFGACPQVGTELSRERRSGRIADGTLRRSDGPPGITTAFALQPDGLPACRFVPSRSSDGG